MERQALGLEPRRAAARLARARGPAPPAGRGSGSGPAGRRRTTARSSASISLARRAAAGALIGARRIGEAVADHPGAARPAPGAITRSMWSRARGVHQQRLGDGRPAVAVPVDQQLAQRLRARRAAGLARAHDLRPRPSRRSTRRPAWVDLPAPSPPSKVMNRPRCMAPDMAGTARAGKGCGPCRPFSCAGCASEPWRESDLRSSSTRGFRSGGDRVNVAARSRGFGRPSCGDVGERCRQ